MSEMSRDGRINGKRRKALEQTPPGAAKPPPLTPEQQALEEMEAIARRGVPLDHDIVADVGRDYYDDDDDVVGHQISGGDLGTGND